LFGRHIRASSVSMGEIRKGRKQSRHKKREILGHLFIRKRKKKTENLFVLAFQKRL